LLWLLAVALWLLLFPIYYEPALLIGWIRKRPVPVWMFTGFN
jgi:hypothetical protein